MAKSRWHVVAVAIIASGLSSGCMLADEDMRMIGSDMRVSSRDTLDRQFRSGPYQNGTYDRSTDSYYFGDEYGGSWEPATTYAGSSKCRRNPELDECKNPDNDDRDDKKRKSKKPK